MDISLKQPPQIILNVHTFNFAIFALRFLRFAIQTRRKQLKNGIASLIKIDGNISE